MSINGIETMTRRYESALASLSAQVGSRNAQLLGIATQGLMAGRTHQGIEDDILNAGGGPRLEVAEVRRAIERAALDTRPLTEDDMGTQRVTRPPRPQAIIQDTNRTSYVSRMIVNGSNTSVKSLMDSSPLVIPSENAKQTDLFLSTLYDPEEILFCGLRTETGALGRSIKTALKWRQSFQGAKTHRPPETLILNPLTGLEGNTQDGKRSYRCADTVSNRKYLLVEFDQMSLLEQLHFWGGVISARLLPLRSVTFSGGKSLHGVIEIPSAYTQEQWRIKVEYVFSFVCNDFAPKKLQADRACINPDRLSRLPGAFRVDKVKRQSLLWLSQTPLKR